MAKRPNITKEYNALVKKTLDKWAKRFLARVRKATPVGEGRSLAKPHLIDAWSYKVYKYRDTHRIKIFLSDPKQQQKFKYAFGPITAQRIFPRRAGGVFKANIGQSGSPVFFKSYFRKARGKHPIHRKIRRIERDVEKRAQNEVDKVVQQMLGLTAETTIMSFFKP